MLDGGFAGRKEKGGMSEFEWTDFMRGFFWEAPKPAYLPPADDAGRREWLAGFRHACADYPDTSDPEAGESIAEALSTLKVMLRPL
jgi:hypothetical protein